MAALIQRKPGETDAEFAQRHGIYAPTRLIRLCLVCNAPTKGRRKTCGKRCLSAFHADKARRVCPDAYRKSITIMPNRKRTRCQ